MVVIVLSMVLLVLFLPARWAVPFVQPRLHGVVIRGVHGLLWDGSADDVRAADGRRLGLVRWQLARSALWGRVDLQLACEGDGLTARGHLQRDNQKRPVWSNVDMRVDLAKWGAPWPGPLGAPQGMLSVTLDHVVLESNWPMEASGRLHWQDAAMMIGASRIVLGTLDMDIGATHGVLHGQPHDTGDGPLHVQGDWQASPLGWRLDLLLRPRGVDPDLRHWLARLGRPASDGSVQLHRRGGLAAAGASAE